MRPIAHIWPRYSRGRRAHTRTHDHIVSSHHGAASSVSDSGRHRQWQQEISPTSVFATTARNENICTIIKEGDTSPTHSLHKCSREKKEQVSYASNRISS